MFMEGRISEKEKFLRLEKKSDGVTDDKIGDDDTWEVR